MRQNSVQNFWFGKELCRRFTETICRLLSITSPSISSVSVFLFTSFVIISVFSSTCLINTITVPKKALRPMLMTGKSDKYPQKTEGPLNCIAYGLRGTCPANYAVEDKEEDQDPSSIAACPEYFRWIHEDLKPWAQEGISREMLDRAQIGADFKLVIKDGKAYVERYRRAFQTRDVFTLWGVLQLLRRYPGRVPDLELMFDCGDWPTNNSSAFIRANATLPSPPLFRYCGDNETFYVVFPDWSFWGWPEINIKPWEGLLKELGEGNKRKRWVDREPYAYWKGNPYVSKTRHQLMKCNIHNKQKHEWNVRAYALSWIEESEGGYKESNLASQCNHRYKLFMEGIAWSVSEKYILACDSLSMLVNPHYYDFFTRSLMPMRHYWPIRADHHNLCKSIKFAVDWGNTHKHKAQKIGKAASDFIQEELKMDYVYDYMFHILNEYAKLLKFKPTIPQKAIELCPEAMACPAEGLERKFMKESMVNGPIDRSPCNLPPPYNPLSLNALLQKKENSIKKVKMWEKNYWREQDKQL